MAEDNNVLEYPGKLDYVRTLPQETESEKETKRVAAQALQMETYLSYADVMRNTEQIINNNPQIRFDALKKNFERNRAGFSHPEAAESFVRGCYLEAVATRNALGVLGENAGVNIKKEGLDPIDWNEEDQKRLGGYIFEKVTGVKPAGNVEVTDSIFGILVVVEDDADLKLLQKDNKNIGGFYRHRQSVVDGEDSVSFPMIAIKDSTSNGGIIRHEVGHAINAVVMNVLNATAEVEAREGSEFITVRQETDDGSDVVKKVPAGKRYRVFDYTPDSPWVYYVEIPNDKKGKEVRGWIKRENVVIHKQESENRWGNGAESQLDTEDLSITNEAELNNFLEVQLKPIFFSMAKDELIADFRRSGNFGYVENVVKKGGTYDHTAEYIDFLKTEGCLKMSDDEVQRVVDEFWKKYEAEVRQFSQAADSLNDSYQAWGLYERKQLLPYVLTMVPLTQWEGSKQRNFLGAFVREVDLYSATKATVSAKQFTYAHDGRYVKARDRFEKLKGLPYSNPTKSMLPDLNACLNELDSLGIPRKG